MKRLFFLFPILGLLMMLTGCPYRSAVPLSNTPNVKVDKTLLGVWTLDSKPDKDIDSLEITFCEFSENEYYLEVLAVSKNKIEIDRHRAFISKVGNISLINIEDLGYKGSYYYFKYSIDNERLTINVVSDILVKKQYKNSKEMSVDFSKLINQKDFFEMEMKFIRKRKE